MGLDLFLFNLSKPEELKIGEIVSEKCNYSLLPVKDYDGKKIDYCKTITDNAICVKKLDRHIDLEKIYNTYSKNAFNEDNIFIKGYIGGEYVISIDKIEYTFPLYVINREFSIETYNDYLAVCMHEMNYQNNLPDSRGKTHLPKNGDYVDDFSFVENLLPYGLDIFFRYNWTESQTVFLAAW